MKARITNIVVGRLGEGLAEFTLVLTPNRVDDQELHFQCQDVPVNVETGVIQYEDVVRRAHEEVLAIRKEKELLKKSQDFLHHVARLVMVWKTGKLPQPLLRAS